MAARALRITGWAFAAILAIVALSAIFLAFLFDWSALRSPLAERIGQATGRGIAIEGPLSVHFGQVVRVHAEKVRLGNPDWAKDTDMARVEAIEVSVRVWPLLQGRVEIPELSLTNPVIDLRKTRDGKASWDFTQNPEGAVVADAAAPSDRSEVPLIERLWISDGRLRYRDESAAIDVEVHIASASGGDPGHDRLRLTGKGSFKGNPAKIDAEAGSLLRLSETDSPFPLSIALTIGDTRAQVKGTIQEPLHLAGMDLRLELSGQDMANLYTMTGVPLPATAPYAISGRLQYQHDRWAFEDFQGKVGASDLRGTVSVETGGPRNLLKADLVSKRLALADLAGFIGMDPDGATATGAPDRVLPDEPLNLEKIRTMDVDVRFNGQQVEVPGLPMEKLDAHLTIQDGLARLDPISFAIAQGTFAGTVAINGRADIPDADLSMRIDRLDLKRFFAGTRFEPETSGALTGKLQLSGKGRSTADVLASADGRATLMMPGGSLSALLVEASGLDVAEALGFAVSGDKAVPVRCMVTDWDIQKGLVTSRALVLDTTDSVISGQGTINLGTERMDLEVEAHPKDPSPFAARTPIDIGGTLGSPSVSLNAAQASARVGAATVLGILLTPLAAVIPFLEPGLGEDSDCAGLVRQATSR